MGEGMQPWGPGRAGLGSWAELGGGVGKESKEMYLMYVNHSVHSENTR